MESSTFKQSSTTTIESMEERFGDDLARSFFDIFDVTVLSDHTTGEPFITKTSHEAIKDTTTVEIASWGRFEKPENWLVEYSKEIFKWMEDAADAKVLNLYDWAYENDMGEALNTLLRYGMGSNDEDIKWARQTIAIQVAEMMLEEYNNFSLNEGI